MITIIGARGSGKAKELLEQAHANNAIILTKDKRGFEVKAKAYGFNNIKILDYEDLENDDYNLTQPILIHNVEYYLDYMTDRYYGLKVIGFSATQETK